MQLKSGLNLVFRGMTFDFVLSSFFLVKKASSTIEQEKCKGYEKCDWIKFRKWNLIFKISQQNKNFTFIDPVLLNWANFFKKAQS